MAHEHLPDPETGRGRRGRRTGPAGQDGADGDGRDAGTGVPELPGWGRWVLVALAAAALAAVLSTAGGEVGGEAMTYSDFVAAVEAGEVERVTIDADGRVEGELGDESSFTTTVPTALPQEELADLLREEDVEVEATAPVEGGFGTVVLSLLPFLLLIGLFWWWARRAAGGQMQQLRGITRSKAKVVDRERPETRFDDIAGYEDVKREVREVVDYLKDPDRYRAAGARGPGGILLVGPPGTGKTMLARAVAGEAEVPFFYATGSGFVEMLVGVGASRVRDLFENARSQAPSIIFIDELDSIGRKRGGSTTIGSNNEQEQTLNELLSEMDGFDPASGVVVMAATNRPGLLDDALQRPGRFDRQIAMGMPILRDRREILAVHVRDKKLADDVDLDAVARATPGMSGADLENLCNEAAIFAVRDGRTVLQQEDFDDARDRIVLGRRRDTGILRTEDKQRVAVHEAGHALVAALSDEADPVSKVTILPSGQALGVTHQLPLDERRLHTVGYLEATLDVRLGGRVAERLLLDELSTGAAHDLAGATAMAVRMVRDFGLSQALGPLGFAGAPDQSTPLAGRPYADGTQELIDEEARRLLREAEARSTELLEKYRIELKQLVDQLVDEETVSGGDIYALVGREPPTRDR
jgi:cell division protease FtsH